MKISPNAAARLVDARNLADRLDCSVRSLYRMLQRGHLPPPVRIGTRTVRWKLTDVLAFIEALDVNQPGIPGNKVATQGRKQPRGEAEEARQKQQAK